MAKVDYYGYMGFVDFMAEREKSQRSAMHMAKVDFMAIWCGFWFVVFIGAAFCPSVFELSSFFDFDLRPFLAGAFP